MKRARDPIKEILTLTQTTWDQPLERAVVRENFRKILNCRTPALGGEVFASPVGEKIFYHTCKSKCCQSCGNRGTLLWQREQWATLPDIGFLGIVFTMPSVFWPIFNGNKPLQHDLAPLAAAVIQQWVWNRFRVRICVVVIQHTFGGRLNYHPHLHIMVSTEGMDTVNSRWTRGLIFQKNEIMELWRYAVVTYVHRAYRTGLFRDDRSPEEFEKVLEQQQGRWWSIHVSRPMSKQHFLGYAGRYIRRLPISGRRITSVSSQEVIYESKDTRNGCFRTDSCSPEAFVTMLSQHVLDRYKHSMRYFGLLSPRTKRYTSAAMFAMLGQSQQIIPRKQCWCASIKKHFGVDPLLDATGARMHWIRRIPSVSSVTHSAVQKSH